MNPQSRSARSVASWVLFLSLLPSGCIEVDETLTIARNGSGVYSVGYSTSHSPAQIEALRKIAAQLRASAGGTDEARDDNPFLFDKEEIAAGLKECERYGVALRDLKVRRSDRATRVDLRLSFNDLAGLMRSVYFRNRSLSVARSPGGEYTLTEQICPLDEEPGANAPGPDARRELAGLLEGFRLKTTIVVPGKISDAGTLIRESQSATWEFNLDGDSTAIRKLQKSTLRVVFSGKELSIPEFTWRPDREGMGKAAVTNAPEPAAARGHLPPDSP